jgi:sulfur carrier protein
VEIIINGRPHPVAEETSLAGAVSLIVVGGGQGVAAAVNGDVVRRTAWESTPLAAGDQVEVVTAVQGG